MKPSIKHSLLLSLLTLLTGCTVFDAAFQKQHVIYNRNYDYLKTSNPAPLQMPPGVYGHNLGSKYVIPAVDVPPTGQRMSLVPPGSMEDQIARGELPPTLLKLDFTKIPNPNIPTPPSQ